VRLPGSPDCDICERAHINAFVDRILWFALVFGGGALVFALWWTGNWKAVLAWLTWVAY
jgi:hypothetical protein